jgi:hypothetical protein
MHVRQSAYGSDAWPAGLGILAGQIIPGQPARQTPRPVGQFVWFWFWFLVPAAWLDTTCRRMGAGEDPRAPTQQAQGCQGGWFRGWACLHGWSQWTRALPHTTTALGRALCVCVTRGKGGKGGFWRAQPPLFNCCCCSHLGGRMYAANLFGV